MSGPGLLDLPVRPGKPRRTGITHGLDRGIPLAVVTGLAEQNGCYVDVWKCHRQERAASMVAEVSQESGPPRGAAADHRDLLRHQ